MAEKLSQTETRRAAAALDGLALVDGLLMGAASTASKAQPGALYAYATDPGFQPDDTLRHLLESDARVQADFQRMLENTSAYYMPKMAAASTGDINTREAGGCRIQFRASKADANQIYAIFEIADPDARPSILFVRHPDGRLDRLELPAFQGGRAQLLLERSDTATQGLMNINAEVYVK